MKVLIVEDSMTIANAMKLLLKNAGITASITEDGGQVVDIIKKEGVKLVILDLMMAKVTGFEVFKRVKEDPQTKSTKILIVSAKTDAMKWHDDLKGCDGFIAKPFDNDVFVNQVKKLLQ